MNDAQFDALMAKSVADERSYRLRYGEPDVPDELLAEHVMLDLLRDAIYGTEGFLIYCGRQVVRHDPRFQTDYDSLMQGNDASDAFYDLQAKEMAARINELLKDLNRRRPDEE